jgi:hypothetical protein
MVAGDPAEGSGHQVHQSHITYFAVRIQIRVEHQLGPTDVEQGRDHGHEDGRRDPRRLFEDR